MSATLNGNGNGNGQGAPSLIRQLEKKAAKTRAPASPHTIKESRVTFQTAEGVELSGTLARVTRHAVYFELYSPSTTPRFSEVLQDFKISLQAQVVYSGNATVRNVLDVGTKLVCEAILRESDWTELNLLSALQSDGELAKQFKVFLKGWQKLYKVSADFKVIIADLQMFLQDLRLWLERVDLKIQLFAQPLRAELERDTIDKLAPAITEAIDVFIDQFEAVVTKLEGEAHSFFFTYLRRQLHPLMLVSPFANRAFNKPLGYAGDYQMVDMMIRSPREGDTLFAKIINIWLLGQSPAQAHRNRVDHLEHKLIEETVRCRASGKGAKIFNLGCGPAAEVQRFFEGQHIGAHADLTLVDFNEETLQHLQKKLEAINRRLPEPVMFRMVKKSVNQILKEGARSLKIVPTEKYDYIYCAGLFDYLSDNVCKQLMNIFYEMLAPGGLLLATNATDVLNSSRPFRYSMEYILDWYLIYRDKEQFAVLAPDLADKDDVTVTVEGTGANLFLEVRKPKNV